MKHKEFLAAFLGKTLNIPADKVASLLNEDETEVKDTALNELLALDAARVKSYKDKEAEVFDNGYKKAQKEVMGQREKEIKEKFGITSEKQGLDLIAEIITAEAGKKAELEPEKVKLHPEYIRLQDDLTKKLKETEKTWKDKYEGREAEIQKEKVFSGVASKADSVLSGYGLPEDVNLAKNQKALLHNELNQYTFQPNGDDYVIVDKDGKVVNDEHGHRKNFESLVNEIASKYWPKLDGAARSGSGAENNPGTGTGAAASKAKANPWKGKVKTEADYTTAMAGAKTAEDRMAIDDAYNEASTVK
jgi:hypothetical protein